MCFKGALMPSLPTNPTATEIRALQEQMERAQEAARQQMYYNQYAAEFHKYLSLARVPEPADYQPRPAPAPKPEPPDPEALRFSKLQLD